MPRRNEPRGRKTHFEGLQQLFRHEIEELFSAENQIVKALPTLIKTASNHVLKQALKDHLAETKNQIDRLINIFDILGEKPLERFSYALDGILQEGENMLSESWSDVVRDVAIIAAAQKVEHYEIACYGIARAHAKDLGWDEVADLLNTTLDEESAADKKLTKIAEGTFFSTGVNKMALEEAGHVAGSNGRKSRKS